MLILKALFFLFFALIITIIQSQMEYNLKDCIELEMNDVGLMFLEDYLLHNYVLSFWLFLF